MKTILWLLIAALTGSFLLAGCGPAAGEVKDYPIKGRVVSVASDKWAVTLVHEDIPDLMRGMEMQFAVADPKVLEGIEAGADVEGLLNVKDETYTITRLQKQ